MASAIKKCRVCGKDYEACRSANPAIGVFRWQEVSCSPECGAVYLEKLNASRGIAPEKKEQEVKYVAYKHEQKRVSKHTIPEIAVEPVMEEEEEVEPPVEAE